jgi:hypothetical protein
MRDGSAGTLGLRWGRVAMAGQVDAMEGGATALPAQLEDPPPRGWARRDGRCARAPATMRRRKVAVSTAVSTPPSGRNAESVRTGHSARGGRDGGLQWTELAAVTDVFRALTADLRAAGRVRLLVGTVDAGLGRITGLYYRAPTLYHIRELIRCLCF